MFGFMFITMLRSLLVSFLALLLLVNNSYAQQSAPEIDAKSWVLIEMNSGKVIASKNHKLPVPPASITKLMMNYVLFSRLASGELKSSDMVPISEHAWRAEGSRMFADVNTRIELGHLLKSTIIRIRTANESRSQKAWFRTIEFFE